MKIKHDIFNYTSPDSITDGMIIDFLTTHNKVEYLKKDIDNIGLVPLRVFEPEYAVIAIICSGSALSDSIYEDIIFDVRDWFYYCNDIVIGYAVDETLKHSEWTLHILIGINEEQT